ncbi:MAG TPA: DUF5683 domain-containing protein [bacterium]|nr:DUF5683 domain-containing protein [bacterium]
MTRPFHLILLLLAGPPLSVLAAEEPPVPDGETPPTDGESDSVESAPAAETVESEPGTEITESATATETAESPAPWRPDPVEALWRSGVIAGWGQFYNEEYLKGVVLFGLEALTVYGIIYYADAAAYERRQFEGFDIPDDRMSPDLTDVFALRDYHLDLYKNYRVDYETHIWLAALVVVYSMLDAYVDAHLADFETGDELTGTGEAGKGFSVELAPRFYTDSCGNPGAGVSLSIVY